MLLQDPVATGDPLNYDRRLPPSVISGFQVTAEDERRDQFTSTPHLRPGLTEHNRFLNVTVGGAHSNIGDSYTANGLGVRSTNLAVDYLNALSDTPFLDKRALPPPSQSVVHRSEQHQWVYSTNHYETLERRGFNYDLAPPRRSRAEVAPAPDAGTSPDMRRADHPDYPRYAQLQAQYGSEEIAAAVTLASKREGLTQIAYAGLSADGRQAYAMDRIDPSAQRVVVELSEVAGRGVAPFNADLQQLNARLAEQQRQAGQGQAPEPAARGFAMAG